ncbi:MAG: hypothetical protein ACK443_04885, partial [Methylococcaceae bacterium]
MLEVDHLNQRVPEHISRLRSRPLRTHKNPDRICKKTGGYYLISGNSRAEKRVFFYDKSMGYELFSADLLI